MAEYALRGATGDETAKKQEERKQEEKQEERKQEEKQEEKKQEGMRRMKTAAKRNVMMDTCTCWVQDICRLNPLVNVFLDSKKGHPEMTFWKLFAELYA